MLSALVSATAFSTVVAVGAPTTASVMRSASRSSGLSTAPTESFACTAPWAAARERKCVGGLTASRASGRGLSGPWAGMFRRRNHGRRLPRRRPLDVLHVDAIEEHREGRGVHLDVLGLRPGDRARYLVRIPGSGCARVRDDCSICNRRHCGGRKGYEARFVLGASHLSQRARIGGRIRDR